MVSEVISGGLFSEGAVDRLFEVLNSAMDRLFNGAFVMCHDDGLAAVAAHLDHATYVIVAGLLTDGVAKVQIDPPYMVTVAVKCGMDQSFYSCDRLLATFDVCVCPDLNQHCLARPYNE